MWGTRELIYGRLFSVPVELRYTRHQVARGSRPDAVKGDKCYLIKNVPHMRLTYQVQLLAEMAVARGMTLIIRLPAGATLSSDMRVFVKSHSHVRVERAA